MDEIVQPELEFKEDLEGVTRLNRRQVLFIAEYLADPNISRASKAAGYKSAHPEILTIPEVVEVIAAERQKQLAKLEVDAEWVVRRLISIVDLDPTNFFDENGKLRPIKTLDEATRKGLAGLEVEELWAGRGESREQLGVVKKIKWIAAADRIAALQLLGKWLKMWTDKLELETTGGLAERMARARENSNKPCLPAQT